MKPYAERAAERSAARESTRARHAREHASHERAYRDRKAELSAAHAAELRDIDAPFAAMEAEARLEFQRALGVLDPLVSEFFAHETRSSAAEIAAQWSDLDALADRSLGCVLEVRDLSFAFADVLVRQVPACRFWCSAQPDSARDHHVATRRRWRERPRGRSSRKCGTRR